MVYTGLIVKEMAAGELSHPAKVCVTYTVVD